MREEKQENRRRGGEGGGDIGEERTEAPLAPTPVTPSQSSQGHSEGSSPQRMDGKPHQTPRASTRQVPAQTLKSQQGPAQHPARLSWDHFVLQRCPWAPRKYRGKGAEGTASSPSQHFIPHTGPTVRGVPVLTPQCCCRL